MLRCECSPVAAFNFASAEADADAEAPGLTHFVATGAFAGDTGGAELKVPGRAMACPADDGPAVAFAGLNAGAAALSPVR